MLTTGRRAKITKVGLRAAAEARKGGGRRQENGGGNKKRGVRFKGGGQITDVLREYYYVVTEYNLGNCPISKNTVYPNLHNFLMQLSP